MAAPLTNPYLPDAVERASARIHYLAGWMDTMLNEPNGAQLLEWQKTREHAEEIRRLAKFIEHRARLRVDALEKSAPALRDYQRAAGYPAGADSAHNPDLGA